MFQIQIPGSASTNGGSKTLSSHFHYPESTQNLLENNAEHFSNIGINPLVFTQTENSKKFKCEICYKPFGHLYNATGHVYTHMTWSELEETTIFHEDCQFCGDIFLNGRSYMRHLKTHNPPPPPTEKCENEEIIAKSQKTCSGPTKTVAKRSKCRNLCYFCPKKFSKPGNLDRHLLTHTKESPFNAQRQFNKSCNFKKQSKTHDKDIKASEKMFKCRDCKWEFQFMSELTLHRIWHVCSDDKVLVIKCCKVNTQRTIVPTVQLENITRKKINLPQLQERDEIVEPVSDRVVRPVHFCVPCKKSFSRQDVLLRHQRSNTHEKGILCPVCGISTKDMKKWQKYNHFQKHKGLKFSCEFCTYKFTTKATAKRHAERCKKGLSASQDDLALDK